MVEWLNVLVVAEKEDLLDNFNANVIIDHGLNWDQIHDFVIGAFFHQIHEESPVRGCWQLGTAGWTGANALLGAQTMFRYGSSTVIDGVQSIGMGIAANSGNISAYAFHYHLAGWTRSFDRYLPDTEQRYVNDTQTTYGQTTLGREAALRNSVIQQCASRVVSVQGTNETQISNNLTFLTYGSAFFLEEGVERHNTFDHNLSIATMLCRPSYFDNPSSILPYTSFDSSAASVYWLKNDRNTCARNVVTACPRPVVAVWLINQKIATMYHGDPERKLPAIGATTTTSQYLPTHYPDGNRYLSDNTRIPMKCLADNVAYNVFTYVSTDIGFYPHNPHDRRFFSSHNSDLKILDELFHHFDDIGDIAWVATDAHQMQAPLLVPASGANTALYQVMGSTSMQPEWDGDGLYDDPSNLDKYDETTGSLVGGTRGLDTGAKCLPSIFAGHLVFANGGRCAIWTKSQATWIINACHLTRGNQQPSAPHDTQNRRSTSTNCTFGDGKNRYDYTSHVFYNHINDGVTRPGPAADPDDLWRFQQLLREGCQVLLGRRLQPIHVRHLHDGRLQPGTAAALPRQRHGPDGLRGGTRRV